jgi:hypothetical protein
MKGKVHFLAKLFIISISFMIFDGGRTFVIVGNNIQSIISHKDNIDLDVPIHVSFNTVADQERWVDSDYLNIIISSCTCTKISFKENFVTSDFSKSIWQPPKFI